MPVCCSKTADVELFLRRGSMYAGQLDTTSFLSVDETSVPSHDAESTRAPSTPKNGSLSAAALSPTKATAPPPRSTPLRVAPRCPDGAGPSLSGGGPDVMRSSPTFCGSCHASDPATRDPA